MIHMMYIYPMNAPEEDTSAGRLAAVDLNLLVLLHAVLEEGSVTRAAERVSLSQPAMSHALRRIRRLFDDEILVGRGVRSSLTPRALQLKAPLRELLHRTTDLLEGARFDPRTDTREVTIAMVSSTAAVVGPGLARLLAREAPGVRLKVLATMDLSDALFSRAGVDLMLLSEAFETDQPRHRLYDDEWVVIAGTDELTNASALRLLSEWPHVALDTPRLLRPYDTLRDQNVQYRIQTRVNDTIHVSHFVAGAERVAVDRRRPAEVRARGMALWLADFPFPIGGVGTDVVWNPWLSDEPFRAWLQGLLTCAARFAS